MKLIRTLPLLLLLSALPVYAQASPGFSKIGNVSTLTYTDAGCADQTTCYYQITAVDAAGHESQPAACAINQLCFATNQLVAVMPSSGTHTVVLAWTASPTTGVTYNIYRAVGPLAAGGATATVN